jgi:hypothetical protein
VGLASSYCKAMRSHLLFLTWVLATGLMVEGGLEQEKKKENKKVMGTHLKDC